MGYLDMDLGICYSYKLCSKDSHCLRHIQVCTRHTDLQNILADRYMLLRHF